MVRKGLLRPEDRTPKPTRAAVVRPKSALEAMAEEETILASHRVQAEARRASKLHSQKTLERRKTSDQRLAERLAARNKVKSSRCLQKSPAFASLGDASVSQIVDVMEYSVLKSGGVLCRQGDAADRMFVIVSGECEVRIDGARIAVLKEHDVFGESALFPDASGSSVRSATVKVSARVVQLLVLHKAVLERLISSGVLNPDCVRALEKVARAPIGKRGEAGSGRYERYI